MHPVSLHCLGVGDGTASTGRNHSAYLYSLGEVKILIDAGEPVSRTLKISGVAADEIDRIIISHLHGDHIGGLLMLLQGWWLDDRTKPLTIFMPKDGIEPLRQLFRTAYLFDEILPFRLNFEAVRPRQSIEVGRARITPFSTTHLDRARKNFQARYPADYAAFAFLLEAENIRIAHSADIGTPADLDPLLAEPVDLLVCELAHFQPDDLFSYLRGRPIKKIIITHVAQYYWDRLDEVRRAAEKVLGHVSFAKDGQLVTI